MKKVSLIWGIVMLVLAFSMGSVQAQDQARFVEVKSLKGLVEVKVEGADWKLAEKGMILRVGDEIRTGSQSYAEMFIDEKAETGKMEVLENTRFRINTLDLDEAKGDKTTYMDVVIGGLKLDVEKLEGDSKFEVYTPTSTVGVRGTIFEVLVGEEEAGQ